MEVIMAVKQKILIVDDDENIAELISLYLIKECFSTEIAHNGKDALRLVGTYDPHLILLDIMLILKRKIGILMKQGKLRKCHLL